jgi:hypothetical protein
MKTLNKFHHKLVTQLIIGGILLLQSCVVYQQSREPAVKVPDIVQMSKDGVTSKDIIRKIRKSHTVFTLKADELSKLQKLGVSDSVINYMERTHINAIRQDAQDQSLYNNWGPVWGGYYYGYPYYGWPYNNWGYWGPSIIYRGGGNYEGHGGGHRR